MVMLTDEQWQGKYRAICHRCHPCHLCHPCHSCHPWASFTQIYLWYLLHFATLGSSNDSSSDSTSEADSSPESDSATTASKKNNLWRFVSLLKFLWTSSRTRIALKFSQSCCLLGQFTNSLHWDKVSQNHIDKQARKPRSYASPKLCRLTYSQG